MKLKANYKAEYISHVNLYLDDIEQIFGLLKDNCEKVSAGGKGYELERPTEIEEYKNLSKEQFDTLEIKSWNPHVSVEVEQSALLGGMRVYIAEDDPKSLGLFTVLTDIAKKRRNKFVTFCMSFNGFLVIAAILSGFLLLLHSKYELDRNTLIVVLLGWLLIRFLILGWPWKRTQVRLRKEYSHQTTSFIARNRDQIMLLLIGAILGFGFSLVILMLKDTK